MFFAFTQCGSSTPCANPRGMSFVAPDGMVAVADFEMCSDLFADEMVYLVTLSAPKPAEARRDFPCTKSFVDFDSFGIRMQVTDGWDADGFLEVELVGDISLVVYDEDAAVVGVSVIPKAEANQTQWVVDLLAGVADARMEDMRESALSDFD